MKKIVWITVAACMLAACSTESSETQTDEVQDIAVENVANEESESLEEGSSEKSIQETNDFSFNQPEAPYVPESMEDVLTYPVGEFALVDPSESEEFQDVLAELPILREEATSEEIRTYIIHLSTLTSPAYPDPRLLANRWEQLSFLAPNEEGELGPEEKELNVEILLDASGSMRDEVDGVDKMTLAREAIQGFVEELPDQANVALRVYGHVGESPEKSCEGIDRVYDLQPYDESSFQDAIDGVMANGWTPLAKAIEVTSDDYRNASKDATNMVLVVSDGMDTCGGDPVQAVKDLSELDVTPLISIIGFDVPANEQQQLREMAQASGSAFATVNDQAQLSAELDRSAELAKAWMMFQTDARVEIEATRTEQAVEIMDERVKWRLLTQDERLYMVDLVQYLNDIDKVAPVHTIEIWDILLERQQAAYDIGEEVYDELYNANEENREQMREKIDELVNEKTE
ncbi:hypothetical protein BpOF4_17775 [Alkalihalophilus pseudofirmus OF4]|uniref:VWFA domain-containing protein n=1 Tax=Alkalihalophilus pseudofirmus (strain ATCC BAA-2126 / JCM 17055 / OF4) TaxID=398511 RepID=D3FRK5_ALKPO|nr:VWA domain-containing protein [Alkalihalophilus pseudofirmus]ADC51596.1 hypothetical protein BpOF4_17775 [Alkalihalophilus pseudofirmus OF4]